MHSHTTAAPSTTGVLIHWANWYDLLVNVASLGQARRVRRLIAQHLDAQVGERILDVGCGTGDLAIRLARKVGHTGSIAAIDASPEMVTRAQQKALRRHLDIDVRLEPVEALTFADHSFDRVVSSFVFHHLPGDLKRQALATIKRVLKPGGQFMLVDLGSANIPRHQRSYTPETELSRLLNEAGFTTITQTSFGMRWISCLSAQTPVNENGRDHALSLT